MKSLNLFLKCVSLVTVVIFLSTSMVWAVPHTQTLKSSQNALAADSKLKEDQTQFKAEYNEKERMFFGYVKLLPGCDEWGYFSLDELESIKGMFGLGIERDLHFGDYTIEDVVSGNAP